MDGLFVVESYSDIQKYVQGAEELEKKIQEALSHSKSNDGIIAYNLLT